MSPDLLNRLQAALSAGAATPTDALQALLLEADGEKCWQRARLLHRLTLILTAQRPVMASSTTHQFKPAFRGKDFSGFPLVVGDKTKMVTASNLADEDIEPLKRAGGGHLIEPIVSAAVTEAAPATDAAFPSELPTGFSYEKLVSDVADEVVRRIQTDMVADLSTDGVRTVNSGILQTAVEQDGDSTIVKHSSGGPDDLPITAPAALQEQAATPEAKPQPELAPAPPTPAPLPVTVVPNPEKPAKKEKH